MAKISFRAYEKLAATETESRRAQTEHEIVQQERAEHIVRLRALRLAKESNDSECARNVSGARATASGKIID
ncbi:MAG: hypothetical protein ACYS0H_26495 [Planctomycetota bacterium]